MKAKKDVLFMCQFFFPEYISSATLPFDTAVALSSAGFSVDVLCGYPKEYSTKDKIPKREVYENINIRRLKYIQLERSSFIGRIVNYLSFTLAVAMNIGALRKYKSVIVYSNPPMLPIIAAIANKVFKTKIVFVCYDVYPEIAIETNSINKEGIISKVMNISNNLIFKRLTRLVALSSEMKSYLLKNREIAENKIKIIPNWFEDNLKIDGNKNIKNTTLKTIKGNNNFVVSYFGNMGICQDMDTIINSVVALKSQENIKFLFAGHGNKVEKIKDVANKEKLENLVILDFLHGEDFQEALEISDCFLVSIEDGLSGLCVPSKTYSYMMMGKPLIAIMEKNCDIVKDLEGRYAGFAVCNGESNELVNSIMKLVDNPTEKNNMGNNCRNIFLEKYTKEHCTQEYVDMFKEILEE